VHAPHLHGLDAPDGRPPRLFCPLAGGCRVCWEPWEPRRGVGCAECGALYHVYCVDPPLGAPPEDEDGGEEGGAGGAAAEEGGDKERSDKGSRSRSASEEGGEEEGGDGEEGDGEDGGEERVARGGSRWVCAVCATPAAAPPPSASSAEREGAALEAFLAALDASRPRTGEAARLLRLAHALGAGAYGGMPHAQRVELLTALAELAACGPAVRERIRLDDEARTGARREAAEIRSRQRAADKEAKAATAAAREAAAAAKVAAVKGEAAAAPSPGEAAPAAGDAGDAAAGKGGKGGGGGGGGKGKRPREAEEPEAPLRSAEEEGRRAAHLEALAERLTADRGARLGADRAGRTYWLLGGMTTGYGGLAVVVAPPEGGDANEGSAAPALASAAPAGPAWGAYVGVDAAAGLLQWLNPRGVREGPLRTALRRAIDAMRRLAAPPPAPPPGAPRKPSAAAQALQAAAAAPAEPVTLTELLPAGADGGAADADGDGEREPPPAPAEALRAALHAAFQTLPPHAFNPERGSEAAQARWLALVDAAASPAHFVAAAGALEAALLAKAFKTGWRMWALPAQHPAAVHAWPGAAFRVHALIAGLKRLPFPKGLRTTRGGAAAAAGAGAAAATTLHIGRAAIDAARRAAAAADKEDASMGDASPSPSASDAARPGRSRLAGGGASSQQPRSPQATRTRNSAPKRSYRELSGDDEEEGERPPSKYPLRNRTNGGRGGSAESDGGGESEDEA
jgi:hypothetical protein